jgi:hypothetical protein
MEHDLPMILVSVGSSLIVGIVSSYLTFRLQFERHRSMDAEREKHWTKWRDGISRDVDDLKKSASLIALAVLSQIWNADSVRLKRPSRIIGKHLRDST